MKLSFAAVRAWARQPTTIGGFMGVAAAVASYLTGHKSAAIIAGSTAIVGLVLPDNSAAHAPADRLLADTITAGLSGNLVAAAPALVSDAEAVVAALPNKEPA